MLKRFNYYCTKRRMSTHWYVWAAFLQEERCRDAFVPVGASERGRALISWALDLILQDQERRTPLHAAACVGDVHVMDLLIESGEPRVQI